MFGFGKYAQGYILLSGFEEPMPIIIDIVNRISDSYQDDSHYLILPVHYLLQITSKIEHVSKYKNIYDKLVRKHTLAMRIVGEKRMHILNIIC